MRCGLVHVCDCDCGGWSKMVVVWGLLFVSMSASSSSSGFVSVSVSVFMVVCGMEWDGMGWHGTEKDLELGLLF